MKRFGVVLLGAAVLAAAVVVVSYRPLSAQREPAAGRHDLAVLAEPARPGATDDTSREVGHLRGEVALLRAELGALRRDTRQGPGAPGDVSTGAAAEMDSRGRSPAAIEEAARKGREYIAGLDSAFQRESIDSSWASSTTAAVRAALASDQVKQTARRVECRARTCRVEIPDDASGALASALPLFSLQIAPALSHVAVDRVTDGRGAATVILYLTKDDTVDGTSLAARQRSGLDPSP